MFVAFHMRRIWKLILRSHEGVWVVTRTRGPIGWEQPLVIHHHHVGLLMRFMPRSRTQTHRCFRVDKQVTCGSERANSSATSKHLQLWNGTNDVRRRSGGGSGLTGPLAFPLMCNFSGVRASSAPRSAAHLPRIKINKSSLMKTRSPPAPSAGLFFKEDKRTTPV